MIAAFLPLPPNPMSEMRQRDNSTSNLDSSNDAVNEYARPINEARYESARWWRQLNRIMSFLGVLIVATIVSFPHPLLKQLLMTPGDPRGRRHQAEMVIIAILFFENRHLASGMAHGVLTNFLSYLEPPPHYYHEYTHFFESPISIETRNWLDTRTGNTSPRTSHTNLFIYIFCTLDAFYDHPRIMGILSLAASERALYPLDLERIYAYKTKLPELLGNG